MYLTSVKFGRQEAGEMILPTSHPGLTKNFNKFFLFPFSSSQCPPVPPTSRWGFGVNVAVLFNVQWQVEGSIFEPLHIFHGEALAWETHCEVLFIKKKTILKTVTLLFKE